MQWKSLKGCSHTRFISQTHLPPQFTVEDSGDSEQDPNGTTKTFWILLSFPPSSSCQLPKHEVTHIHANTQYSTPFRHLPFSPESSPVRQERDVQSIREPQSEEMPSPSQLSHSVTMKQAPSRYPSHC